MANSPRKPKDPTDLALSAIEDALNVHDTQREPTLRRSPGPLNAEPRRGRGQAEADDARLAESDIPAAPRVAANDDRESVGHLLRALQRRPSRTPYVVAWLFTAFWTILFEIGRAHV